MSYFRLYFDNSMKNLGVIYDNFFPQNLAKSREPREVVVTPIQSKFNWENLSRFITFSPKIFLKHLFLQYILIIYCKIKRRLLKKMATTKFGFSQHVDISAIFEFFSFVTPKLFINLSIFVSIVFIKSNIFHRIFHWIFFPRIKYFF